jgi:hypothetical protein
MSDETPDEAPELHLTVKFDVKSGLFIARLDNGTRFNFSPNNVSGKLGANLDLLRGFTQRNAKQQPPHPHVAAKTVKDIMNIDLTLLED